MFINCSLYSIKPFLLRLIEKLQLLARLVLMILNEKYFCLLQSPVCVSCKYTFMSLQKFLVATTANNLSVFVFNASETISMRQCSNEFTKCH